MAIQQVKVTPSVTHKMGDTHFRNASEILTLANSLQVPARNHFNRIHRWVKALPAGTIDPDLLLTKRACEAHASFSSIHDLIEATAVLKHLLDRDYPKDGMRREQLDALLKAYRLKLRKCRQVLNVVASGCMPPQMHAHVDEVITATKAYGLQPTVMYLASPSEGGIDFFAYIAVEAKRRYLLVSIHKGVPYANVISRYAPPNRLVKGLATSFKQLAPLCKTLIEEEVL